MTTIADFSIEQLAGFLSLSLTDERLIAFLGPLVSTVKRDRDSYYAFLPLPEQGVDFVFNEAPWVLPRGQITDEKALHLAAIHFHREAMRSTGVIAAQCRMTLNSMIRK
jgi:hypothetical protein